MTDPFGNIRAGTDAHRRLHRCNAYPYSEGALLGVMAAASGARRIVELGTALGYTALWLAHGARAGLIDTIERDPEHARLARGNAAAHGMGERITVHDGDFETVLPTLAPPYDMAFFDGYGPTLGHLAEIARLLRAGGVLVATNLDVGRDTAVRDALSDGGRWLTSFAAENGRTALAIKL